MSASGGLEEWAERFGGRRPGFPPPGRLRFAFYGRVSTEDWQNPVMSRARQREQAETLVRGHGMIVEEFFDVGQSRSVAWNRRPQAAALPAQLADLGRDWEAVVIGEYERAFYGSQYALLAPLYSAVRRPAFLARRTTLDFRHPTHGARPPRRLIPVAALDLHLQFYTSKVFPETLC